MAEQETKFWEDVISASNPGWGVTVDPQWGAADTVFSGLTVNVYVYDTKTDWKAAGASTVADMASAKAMVETADGVIDSIANLTAVKIAQAADAKSNSDQLPTKEAITLATGYLTSTRTYGVVMETFEALDGHWLVILYRLNDGTLLARPTFAQGRNLSAGLKSPTELRQWVQKVVYADTSNSSTSVYKTIMNAQGADLSPVFH